MATRYTVRILEADLHSINVALTAMDSPLTMIIGQRNGYTAVDMVTVEQRARHCIQYTLECGSPRECLAAAQSFATSYRVEWLQNQLAEKK